MVDHPSSRERNLLHALETRDVIGQAKGILMERHALDADAAFELLRVRSQHLNRKLAHVAEELCLTGRLPGDAGCGGEPPWLPRLVGPDAAIVVTDAAGVIRRWGDSAQRLYGYAPEEARGRNIIALLGDPAEAPAVEAATAAAAAGGRRLSRRRVRRADGETFVLVGFAIRVDDGDEPLLVGVCAPAASDAPLQQPDDPTWRQLEVVARERAARLAVEEAAEVLARVNRLAGSLAALDGVDVPCTSAAKEAAVATAASSAAVLLLEDGELVVRGSWGGDDSDPTELGPLGTGAMRERTAVWHTDGAAAVPLVADDGAVGVLVLRFDGPRIFRSEDRALLLGVAEVTAHAVGRARAFAAGTRAAVELDALLAAAPVGFALLDRDRRVVRTNDHLARITGGRAADLAAALRCPVARVLVAGEPVLGLELTDPPTGAPGEARTWIVDVYPVPGVDGAVLGAGIVVRDVTDLLAGA